MKFWAQHPVLLGVCILLAIGLVGAYWQAALVILVFVAFCYAGVWWMVWLDKRSRELITRRWGLQRRADFEHWLVMNGDDRGVWGQYPPAV